MTTEKKETDIVDIIKDFFSWIGRLLKSIGMGFLYFIRFSFQNLIILIVFFILGIVAAVLLSSFNKVYQSDLTLRLNISNSYEFYELTKALDVKLVGDVTLAQKMNLPDSVVEPIKKIKGNFVIDNGNNNTPDWIDYDDEFIEHDTINVRMLNWLVVTVRTKDLYSYPAIQNGILYFYANDETLKKEREIRTKQQRQMLNSLQNEINRLDSLSNKEYFKEPAYRTLTIDSQVLLLGEKPKQLYYPNIVKLQNSKDSLEDIIEMNNEVVSVIKPFTVTKKPIRSLPKMLVFCTLFFVFIGYMVALYVRYKKEVWGFLNEKK